MSKMFVAKNFEKFHWLQKCEVTDTTVLMIVDHLKSIDSTAACLTFRSVFIYINVNLDIYLEIFTIFHMELTELANIFFNNSR